MALPSEQESNASLRSTVTSLWVMNGNHTLVFSDCVISTSGVKDVFLVD